MTIGYHPLAEIELEDAVLYYERRQSGLGERFALEVFRKLAVLLQNPRTGGRLKNKYREILGDHHFPFLIVYSWKEELNEIFISSIFHSKRHPGQKFRKP